MIVDVLADPGLVVASVVREVVVCFSLRGACAYVVFILLAVETSILASRYVLDWDMLWFSC